MLRAFGIGVLGTYAAVVAARNLPLQNDVVQIGDSPAVVRAGDPAPLGAEVAVDPEIVADGVAEALNPGSVAVGGVAGDYLGQAKPLKPLAETTRVYPSGYKDGLGPIMRGMAFSGEDIAVNYMLPEDGVHECREMCREEARCEAWTYARPGAQGALGQCWLKGATAVPREDDCCDSGARIPLDVRENGGVQYAVDYWSAGIEREGGGYRGEMSLYQCDKACADDSKCQAYTLLLPENARPAHFAIGNPVGQCFTKQFAPLPFPNECCISGVPGVLNPAKQQIREQAAQQANESDKKDEKSTGDKILDALLPWRW